MARKALLGNVTDSDLRLLRVFRVFKLTHFLTEAASLRRAVWLARGKVVEALPVPLDRRASADENSDLFWGLCGGRSTFAVVSGMEIDLVPVSMVYGGSIVYPAELARDVLEGEGLSND